MTDAPEEIEVNVRQLDESGQPSGPAQLGELLRRLFLAGIGAVSLSREEAEEMLGRLVERGEIAQKDAEKLMNETMERMRPRPPEPTTSGFSAQVENNLEQFLNRLNIPSKRDIDELSAKIAHLAARVEELRRSQANENQ